MSSVTDRLNDFPDRLSPMLVKELRQGLRARTFVIVFLVLQGLLGLILLIASAGATSAHAGQKVSEIVFVFYALAVLVIQPLRGVAALASEIRGQTIDLMVLTRLSALRIVLGKWVAIISQSALLACTIIPYLILRYYFGGMNLFAELLMVAMIFLVSSGLTAMTVGLSACSSILIRGLLPILGTPMLVYYVFNFGFGGELTQMIELFGFSNSRDAWGTLLFAIAILYLGWSALSLGASLIAPHAENHATLRRLIALGIMLLLAGLVAAIKLPREAAAGLWFLFSAPAIGTALSEPEQWVATVCRPFVRKGGLGVLFGRLLYPGWASGVVFTLVIAGVGFLGLATMKRTGTDVEPEIMMTALLGSLLLPATIMVLAGSKVKDRAATFILLWIAFAVLGGVVTSMAETISSQTLLWAFVWDPLVLPPMPRMVASSGFNPDVILMTGIAIDSVYAVILLTTALMAFRRLGPIEEQALAE